MTNSFIENTWVIDCHTGQIGLSDPDLNFCLGTDPIPSVSQLLLLLYRVRNWYLFLYQFVATRNADSCANAGYVSSQNFDLSLVELRVFYWHFLSPGNLRWESYDSYHLQSNARFEWSSCSPNLKFLLSSSVPVFLVVSLILKRWSFPISHFARLSLENLFEDVLAILLLYWDFVILYCWSVGWITLKCVQKPGFASTKKIFVLISTGQ